MTSGVPFTSTELISFAQWSTTLSFGYAVWRQWSRRQDRLEEQGLLLRKFELEQQRELQEQAEEAAIRVAKTSSSSANSGGYIVMDMPEDQKRMFHDVLKGFEEFALLKGYSVSFSLDGSVPDKVAFKFTILDRGVSVSTKKVQDDLKEYIERVQNGDSLDDLPVVLPDAEHGALVLVMRNRINFLQHTYNAQRNVVEFYERILREGGVGQAWLAPAQNFYLQGGGSMSSKNYTAIGSSRVVQGDDNEVDQSIHIAESFIEKKNQLENIGALIQALTNAHQPAPTEETMRAVVNLEKVKDELETELKPDAGRIKKWLETAKSSIKALALGKDVIDLAVKTFKDFEVPF